MEQSINTGNIMFLKPEKKFSASETHLVSKVSRRNREPTVFSAQMKWLGPEIVLVLFGSCLVEDSAP